MKPGARVWLRFEGFELDGLKLKGTRAKLRPKFVGPFSVTERISPVSFRIKLPQSKIDTGLHDVFHSRNLIVDKPNAESVLPPEKFESTYGEMHRLVRLHGGRKVRHDPLSVDRLQSISLRHSPNKKITAH